MANTIIGNKDSEGGRNESYSIPGRGTVPRKQLVKEIEQGRHQNFSIYEVDGEKFVRSNPNVQKGDNVNR